MIGTLFGMFLGSRSAVLFLVYISLLQIGWIFLNCYLYSALIAANNLLVPAATPFSTLGSVVGASAMGYMLDHGGVTGSLTLTVVCMLLTAVLTVPFLRAPMTEGPHSNLPPLAPVVDDSQHDEECRHGTLTARHR
jgi:hypothetical protein